jgi:Tfp pilus assembly protein PilF
MAAQPRNNVGRSQLRKRKRLESKEEAVTQFKRVVEMDPNFEATYPWLVNTLKLQGKETEALEWFMKWQEVRKADQETLQTLGMRITHRAGVVSRSSESKI